MESEVSIEKNENATKAENDPYAYLEKNGFTSEKFKIEIRNLPKYYGIGELKRLLNEKLKLKSTKIKPARKRSSWLFVCFRCEEDRQEAIKAIDGYTWKNKQLTAGVAKAAPDPLVKRRNEDRLPDYEAKRPKLDTTQSQEEVLKHNATPFWNVPYRKQLEDKTEAMKAQMRRYINELATANRSLKPWVEHQMAANNGLACPLLDIVAVPEKCNGYRNKCEFTIGRDTVTNERTIGFRLGTYAAGTIGVGSVGNLDNICDRMKSAVQVFEKFVRESEVDVYNPETQLGSWRQVTARHGVVTDQLMFIVGVHPQEMSDEELQAVKNNLKTFFASGVGKEINLTSLYFQILRKRQSGEDMPKAEHLLGSEYIEEELCGLKFRITPEIFFQVNTVVAELLYDSVRSLATLDQETTLVDVCCGTGTIGLCLAKHCGQVLGLELQEEAIEVAKENAVQNQIDNCWFFSGKAEDILSAVICKATKKQIVAVVNPPRAGLHQKGVVHLRRSPHIKKLVYVACDIKSAMKNMIDLARPASKTLHGDPFVPVKAVPVDMFPHTKHCELVICLERIDSSAVESYNQKVETSPEESTVVSTEQ